MAEEFKIIAKIVTDDKQAKVSAEATGKEIAKKVDSGAEKAKFGDTLNKQFDKVKKNTFADSIKGKLQDVKKGIQAVGVSGDRLSKIGDFFKGGVISAFAAAALMAGQALKKMWDDAHESAEQYYQRMKKNQEILEEAINKSQEESRATNEWFNRLHEINNLEKISNAQKAQASMLIEALTRQYGQLGITVDGTTGRYENLYEAQLKVLDLQYEAELRLRQQKRDSYLGSGGSAHASAVQIMRELAGDKYVLDLQKRNRQGMLDANDRKIFSRFINLDFYGGDLQRALNMGLDIKLQQYEWRKRKVRLPDGRTIDQLYHVTTADSLMNQGWNQGGLQGKLQWVRYMRNHKNYRGNADFQQLLNQIEKQILEAMVASEQYSAYRATGKPSEQRALQDVSANNRRIQQQRARGEDVERQNAERRQIQQQQAEYSRLDTSGKIDWQTRKNNEAKTEISRATAEVARLQAEYQQSDKNLAEIIKSGDTAKIEIAQKQHLELLQRLNAEKQKLEDARNTEQSSRLEIQRLRQQLAREQQQQGNKDNGNDGNGSGTSSKPPLTDAEIQQAEKDLAELQTKTDDESVKQEQQLRRRIAQYYSSQKQHLQFQIRQQRLINEGKTEEAKREEIIYKLKASGKKFTDDDVTALMQSQEELDKLRAEYEAEKQRQKQEAERQRQAEEAERERQKQEAERKAKSNDYYRQSKQQAEYELRYQKLLLQGRFSEAQQLRIINDLKKQGLKLSEQQIEEIVIANNRLADLAIKRQIVSFGKGIMQGKGSKREQLKAEADEIISAMEQSNKRFLSDSEKTDIRELLKLREKLNGLPDVESYQMQSNQLTRRGGFKTGYVDNADRINRQIASNTAKTNDYLQQIKLINQRNGRF